MHYSSHTYQLLRLGGSEAECTPRKLAITYAYLSTHVEGESNCQCQTDTINTTPSLPLQLIMYRTGRQHSRSTSNISTTDNDAVSGSLSPPYCVKRRYREGAKIGEGGGSARFAVGEPVEHEWPLFCVASFSNINPDKDKDAHARRKRDRHRGGRSFLASGPRDYRCGRNQSVFEYDASREG